MNTSSSTPVVDGLWFRPRIVTPNDVSPAATAIGTNAIAATDKVVEVAAVVNDANDWITLPLLSTVPNGHEITILCSAGGGFEMRTPAASGDKINNVDSDGTNEYVCTDTEIIKVVKISNTIGWMAHAYSAIGAVVVAVVPHA